MQERAHNICETLIGNEPHRSIDDCYYCDGLVEEFEVVRNEALEESQNYWLNRAMEAVCEGCRLSGTKLSGAKHGEPLPISCEAMEIRSLKRPADQTPPKGEVG